MVHRKKSFVIISLFLVALYIIAAPLFVIQKEKRKMHVIPDALTAQTVAVVFGAGIHDNGTPKDMLKDRLISAAELYRAGKISRILVSGDNRFVNYNEPDAMAEYLITTEKIPKEIIVADYAGRSTYETCARAKHIFGVDHAILVTQKYHLPRAMFLCRVLGVQNEGYSASRQLYRGQARFTARELLAIHKAILSAYVWRPDVVGGAEEIDIDP